MHLYTKITIWLSIFYYRFLLSCHTAVSYISTYIHILETSFLKTIIWSLWLSVTACGELEVAAYRFLSTSNQGEVQRNFGRRCNKIVSEKCYRQGQKIPSFSSLLPPYPTLFLILSVSATRTSGIPPFISHLFLRTLSAYKWHLLKDIDAGSLCLSSLPISWPGQTVCLSCLISQRIDKFDTCTFCLCSTTWASRWTPVNLYSFTKNAMGIFSVCTAQHINTKRMSNKCVYLFF